MNIKVYFPNTCNNETRKLVFDKMFNFLNIEWHIHEYDKNVEILFLEVWGVFFAIFITKVKCGIFVLEFRSRPLLSFSITFIHLNEVHSSLSIKMIYDYFYLY